MAETKPQEQVAVSAHDLALSNMLGIEALMRVLVAKGLITEKEVMEELETVNRQWAEAEKQHKGG